MIQWQPHSTFGIPHATLAVPRLQGQPQTAMSVYPQNHAGSMVLRAAAWVTFSPEGYLLTHLSMSWPVGMMALQVTPEKFTADIRWPPSLALSRRGGLVASGGQSD